MISTILRTTWPRFIFSAFDDNYVFMICTFRKVQQRKFTSKMNSRFFKLCRVYSNSLKMSNPGADFLGTHLSLERERKIRPPLFTSAIKRKIRHFQVVVVQ